MIAPGDRVWLSPRNLPLRLPCRKRGPGFVGPFKVLRRLNEVCYRLQLHPDYPINPSFHVALLRPVVADPLQESEVREVPPHLLAIADPLFIFLWFCLVFHHTWFQFHQFHVVYLTLCSPSLSLSVIVCCCCAVSYRVLFDTFLLYYSVDGGFMVIKHDRCQPVSALLRLTSLPPVA